MAGGTFFHLCIEILFNLNHTFVVAFQRIVHVGDLIICLLMKNVLSLVSMFHVYSHCLFVSCLQIKLI